MPRIAKAIYILLFLKGISGNYYNDDLPGEHLPVSCTPFPAGKFPSHTCLHLSSIPQALNPITGTVDTLSYYNTIIPRVEGTSGLAVLVSTGRNDCQARLPSY